MKIRKIIISSLWKPLFLLAIFFGLSSSSVQAASINWTGGSGNWETGANWSGGSVPGADDDVTIDADVVVSINGTTTINSLILGNVGETTTPELNFSYNAMSTGALVIDDGDLNTHVGSNITHTAGTSSVVGTVVIDVQTGNATIKGTINTNSKGYQGGAGPGKGSNGGWNIGGGGGAYGGNGGKGETGIAGGTAYDNIVTPITIGSGGGNGYKSTGSKGGGLVNIAVAGTLTVDGTISANGEMREEGSTNAGGGAGGGIEISAGVITGAGGITANGGDGDTLNNSSSGGGGGGRIAIYYDQNTHSGSITAYGGAGDDNAGQGGAGTIFRKDNASSDGDLEINNNSYTKTSHEDLRNYFGTTPVDTTATFEDIVVSNNGEMTVETGVTVSYSTLTYTGATVVENGTINFPSTYTVPATATYALNAVKSFDNLTIAGVLTHTHNTDSQIYSINLSVSNNLEISSGGKIDLDYRGYQDSTGLGEGSDGGWNSGGGGAAHGGDGGNSESGVAGGSAYGSTTAPDTIGSGGGNGYKSRPGGKGGGLASITVTGTLTVDGVISANGETSGGSTNAGVGGGAGGGILINTNSLTGTGNITANGGNGETGNSTGGGGGGGRIAIYHGANSLSGDITATGGIGYEGAMNGADGSVYTELTNSAPTATTPSSIYQSSTGTGYITFNTTISDSDADDTKLKVEYSDDGGLTWYDPILVSATSDSGTVDLDNDQAYQVGTVDAIDTSGADVTLTIIWDTQSTDNGNGSLDDTNQSDIQLRVTPHDGNADGSSSSTSSFEIDNLKPSDFGNLSTTGFSANSIDLAWTAATENNFTQYIIWFGTVLSDVASRIGSATAWNVTDDLDLSNILTTSTTITGLSGTTYYFQAWALDNFGNELSSNSISQTLNQDPNSPTNLGPNAVINGSWLTNSQPTITFNLTDPDTSDTVRYQLQIDDTANFSSPVVDYTSGLGTQGEFVFTVGQTAGSGTYTTGTASQTLTAGSYYFRVKTIDVIGAESSYTTANSGSVAFKIDATQPTSFTLESPKSYINNSRPTYRWKAPTDSGSGLAKYTLNVDNGSSGGNFTIDNISATNNSDVSTDRYEIKYDNNYIAVYTKGHLSWNNANDGKLREGKRSWKITATDSAGNSRVESADVLVDLTSPSISSVEIEKTQLDNISVTGTLSDSKNGSNTNGDDKIKSDLSRVEIKLYLEKETESELVESKTISLGENCDTSDANVTRCNFTQIFLGAKNNATYQINITGYDRAGNSISTQETLLTASTTTQTQIELTQTNTSPQSQPITTKTIKEEVKELLKKAEVVKKEITMKITSNGQNQVISSNNDEVTNIHLFTDQEVSLNIPEEFFHESDKDIQHIIALVENEAFVVEKVGGNYSASFRTPQVKGAYTVQLLATYSDGSIKTTPLSLVVDPYGYVYYLDWKGREVRIAATVSLYKLENEERVLWTGENENPVKTGANGEFNFFVEPGIYVLAVNEPGFKKFETQPFEVQATLVNINLQLQPLVPIQVLAIASITGIIASAVAAYILIKKK